MSLLQSQNNIPTGVISTGGNSFGADLILGTIDEFDVIIKTFDTEVIHITSDFNVGIGTSTPGAKLDINGTLKLSTATASGTLAVALGDNCISSGDFSFTEGSGTLADADYAHAQGYATKASGVGSDAVGIQSFASQPGQSAYANGAFFDAGDAQYTRIMSKGTTVDTETVRLSDPFPIELNKSYHVTIRIIARTNTSSVISAAWKYEGIIQSVDGSTIDSDVTESSYHGLGAWSSSYSPGISVAITDLGSGNLLSIDVNGESGENILWVAYTEFVEVAHTGVY